LIRHRSSPFPTLGHANRVAIGYSCRPGLAIYS
jgi:hypothetical protein